MRHWWTRSFQALTALLVLSTSGLEALAQPPKKSAPNILLMVADNWAAPHAGAMGDPVVRTPTFDRLAREGVLFTHAFGPIPSCAPSRACLLSGQIAIRLGAAANNWGTFSDQVRVYTDLLRTRGYFVGFTGKGWSPGGLAQSGRQVNPAGKEFKDFKEFLDALPPERPFCFWFGSRYPHTPWKDGQEHKKNLDPQKVKVPPSFPDHPAVRDDILNYYCEVQEFDREAGELLDLLKARGLLDQTLIVMTSDNGWQMPRGLGNVYDSGVHIPMVVRWDSQLKAGQKVDAFVTITDLAPTFLEAAGIDPLPEMTGRSLMPLMKGHKQEDRDHVFLVRERHANVRKGNLGYPIRALRTKEFLYIHNLHPERWPAGDPELYFSVGPYGDIDPSQTKTLLQNAADDPRLGRYFKLIFGKRPAEELYDLAKDPGQVQNVAAEPAYSATLKQMRGRVQEWMNRIEDPRAAGDTDLWDKAPYFGGPAKKK